MCVCVFCLIFALTHLVFDFLIFSYIYIYIYIATFYKLFNYLNNYLHYNIEIEQTVRKSSQPEVLSISTQLKSTCKLAGPLGGFHPDLGLKAGISLKLLVSSFRKFYLHLILRENSSKSFLSSGSYKVF